MPQNDGCCHPFSESQGETGISREKKHCELLSEAGIEAQGP